MFLNINYNKIRERVSVVNKSVLHKKLDVVDSLTSTDKILNGKFHFLCSCDVLTQVVGVNFYWDKLPIAFSLNRCSRFKETEVNLYSSPLRRTYEDSLNAFKVFLYFKLTLIPVQTL